MSATASNQDSGLYELFQYDGVVMVHIFGTIDERDRPMFDPLDRTGDFLAVRFELVRISLLESTPFGRVMAEPFAQCSRRRVLLPPIIDTGI